VQRKRLGGCPVRFIETSGLVLDLGEVNENAGVCVEEVGRPAQRHRLLRKRFGLLDEASPGHDPGAYASPDDLREHVVARRQFLADLGELPGFLSTPLGVESLSEMCSRGRMKVPIFELVE